MAKHMACMAKHMALKTRSVIGSALMIMIIVIPNLIIITVIIADFMISGFRGYLRICQSLLLSSRHMMETVAAYIHLSLGRDHKLILRDPADALGPMCRLLSGPQMAFTRFRLRRKSRLCAKLPIFLSALPLHR